MNNIMRKDKVMARVFMIALDRYSIGVYDAFEAAVFTETFRKVVEFLSKERIEEILVQEEKAVWGDHQTDELQKVLDGLVRLAANGDGISADETKLDFHEGIKAHMNHIRAMFERAKAGRQ